MNHDLMHFVATAGDYTNGHGTTVDEYDTMTEAELKAACRRMAVMLREAREGEKQAAEVERKAIMAMLDGYQFISTPGLAALVAAIRKRGG